ncbi:glutamine amidotransferase class-I [Haloterrigena turkmenica DSM 5511]|uniref:Glutamine amidotransferase class-I n=1 Tax=Haloterrigena turkmenica (strain ATCC 51198 / DSM 5511 / JCM 9101 / NCIMB 13204 / VKM B-1734 / 4k) TaxID=543526 RepID=D2RZH5_HALTV|nr:type 1 glutamine amidotransferase [Haloterrigena turkmenica]ADB62014.1 glutamine amidotransferase class-I [Haloterrigena turkmenica DSM 5511]
MIDPSADDRLRIALLNAAHKRESTRRNFERELDAELVEFHCPSGELPDTFDFDACVVTGSSASVYWDRPWIGALKEWVGEAVAAGLPFLGVCYGHQLLADVLGGRVEDMGEYEIGYRAVEHDGANRLLTGVGEEFTVFTTHSDRVAAAPPDATVFARNEYGIHGFRRDRVFGVQFHPEYDMTTAERVTAGKDGDLEPERIQSVLEGIDAERYETACEAKRLFDNFVGFVREQRSVECGADVAGTDAAATVGEAFVDADATGATAESPLESSVDSSRSS